MSTHSEPGERSVAIGGNVENSQFVTGDNNQLIGTLVVTAGDERDLEISFAAAVSDGYLVTATLQAEQRAASATYAPPFSALELRSAVAALETGHIDDPAVHEFGARLFDALVRGPIKALYDELRRREVLLRVRIVTDNAELASTPWELLFDRARGEYVPRDGSVVRTPAHAVPVARPVRITAPLRLAIVGTSSSLRGALKRQAQFEVQQVQATRLAGVRADLLHVAAAVEDLPAALGSTRPRAVVLSGATLETLTQVAPSLLAMGVAAVVGVPASSEAAELYQSLAEGAAIDRSLPPGAVCFLAPGSARLIELAPGRVTLRQRLAAQLTPTRLAATAITLLGALASIAILLPILMQRFGPLPKMTGTFRVAVPEFTLLDDHGAAKPWDSGHQIAMNFAGRLDDDRKALGVGSALVVRAPDGGTRAVVGPAVEQRAEAAGKLAQEIDADVIVTGTMQGTTFTPELYLSSRLLGDQTDAGYYGLGSIRLRDNADVETILPDQTDLSDALLRQTGATLHLLLGLNAYGGSRFDVAQTSFETALRCLDAGTCTDAGGADTQPAAVKTSANETGRALLYLFLGNSALKQAGIEGADRRSSLSSAGTFFDRALQLDAQYGRATVGQAEVAYLQSLGRCQRNGADTNVQGMRQAETLYREALVARNSRLSLVDLKSAFGLGRVNLCLSQMGIDGYTADEAVRWFGVVTDAYDRGTVAVRPWAAESHLALGVLYSSQRSDPPRALKEFESAVQLLSEPRMDATRKQVACRLLGGAALRAERTGAAVPSSVSATVDKATCQDSYAAGYDAERQRLGGG